MAKISGAELTKAMARVLTEASAKLDKVALQLEITEGEQQEMLSLARSYLKAAKTGRQVKTTALAGAVLYMRLYPGKVLSFRDVSTRLEGSPKHYDAIGNLYKDMKQHFHQTNLAPVRAQELINSILDQLHLEARAKLQGLAEQIASVLGDEEVHEGSTRAGVAAAAILLAAKAHSIKLTRKDLASVSNVSCSRLTDLQEMFIQLAHKHQQFDLDLSKGNVHYSVVHILMLVEEERRQDAKHNENNKLEIQQEAPKQPVCAMPSKRKRMDQQAPDASAEGYAPLNENEGSSAPQEKRLRVDIKPGEKEQEEQEEKGGDTTDDEELN